MNVQVIENQLKYFRLTVTANDDVRIKIKEGVTEEEKQQAISKLTDVAQYLIDNNLNTVTLRGGYDLTRTVMQFKTGNKKLVTKLYVDPIKVKDDNG